MGLRDVDEPLRALHPREPQEDAHRPLPCGALVAGEQARVTAAEGHGSLHPRGSLALTGRARNARSVATCRLRLHALPDLSYTGRWQTASTLLPSGSST